MFSLGIDPGWKNLGFAAVKGSDSDYRVEILRMKTFNPSAAQCPEKFVYDEILEAPREYLEGAYYFDYATIERYVAYANVKTSETENITTLIGMLNMGIWERSDFIKKTNLRAIDWKVYLCQTLAKHVGFQNPSLKLDKKFSIAAAKAVLLNPDKYEFKSDHEADAICLAALPFVCQTFGDPKGFYA